MFKFLEKLFKTLKMYVKYYKVLMTTVRVLYLYTHGNIDNLYVICGYSKKHTLTRTNSHDQKHTEAFRSINICGCVYVWRHLI